MTEKHEPVQFPGDSLYQDLQFFHPVVRLVVDFLQVGDVHYTAANGYVMGGLYEYPPASYSNKPPQFVWR